MKDTVYLVWFSVRYEGESLVSAHKSLKGAIKALRKQAKNYDNMKLSKFSQKNDYPYYIQNDLSLYISDQSLGA